MAMAALIIVFVLFLARITAEIIIPTNTTEVRLTAFAWNEYLGVSTRNYGPDAANVKVRGTIYRYAEDPCDTNLRIDDDFTGRIVLVTHPMQCPYFTVYDRFADRNATAIIIGYLTDTRDFYFLKSMYDQRAATRNNHAVAVERIFPDATKDAATLADGTVVQVRADIDPGVLVRRSLWIQALLRWIPFCIYAVVSTMSIRFLYSHIVLVRQERRGRSWLRSLTLIHVALVIAVVKNTTMTLALAVGGYFTDSVMPYEFQYMFATHLISWENAIAIISARFWHQVISKSDAGHRSYLFSTIGSCVFMIFALILDMIGVYMAVTYRAQLAGIHYKQIISAAALLATIGVALYFTISVFMFHVRLRQGIGLASRPTPLIQRLQRLVVLFSAVTFVNVCDLLYFATHPMKDADQFRVIFVFIVINVTVPLRSLCSVLMLKPRDSARYVTKMPVTASPANNIYVRRSDKKKLFTGDTTDPLTTVTSPFPQSVSD